ncbi:LytR C-terminal domain-containing protein [Streptomyces sp. NPDC052396]|uniref:LCP family protein n=1 Tax=Streptomyces sp. NPDC052396 TaxID=3365689 RepID=UPI0037D58A3C
MNDRQDPYAHDPYAYQPQVYGYDAYGRPVYQPDAPERVYDVYGQPLQQFPAPEQGHGYDPYAAGRPQQPYDPADAAAHQPQPHAQPYTQPQTRQQERIPRQAEWQDGPAAPAEPQIPEPRQAPDEAAGGEVAGGEGAGGPEAPVYRTEQFSFVETPDEESEDVIDWLKFSESRSERRDERKRKGRNRYVALGVALVLVLAGGLAWFFLAGSDQKKGAGAGGAQQRDVIVVHLRQIRGGGSSTALLVDNRTTGKATTVLLPNSLAVAKEGGGATTLGKSVTDAGTGATRDALNTLLGSQIKGSWRLDTPYLENLVQLAGGITLDADTDVPGAKPGDDPLVHRGSGQSLNGQTAVAYATYRAAREDQTRQLARFGQVMQAVLKKLSTDSGAATNTVEQLAQIPDPSLSVKDLGASLAGLATRARAGAYTTTLLPVRADGTLDGTAADQVVREVLGGAVKSAGRDSTPRVSVKNATGGPAAAQSAQVALVNGGYTYLDGGTAHGQGASAVVYTDDKRADDAREVAKTLGLPVSAVRKGQGAANADITVVLGKDFRS